MASLKKEEEQKERGRTNGEGLRNAASTGDLRLGLIEALRDCAGFWGGEKLKEKRVGRERVVH